MALAEHLSGHQVSTVSLEGWSGVKNGKLLRSIESAQFDAFLTADKRMQFEQTLDRQPFAVLLLSTNHKETMEPHYAMIAAALDTAPRGKLTTVECGRFLPRRHRNPLR